MDHQQPSGRPKLLGLDDVDALDSATIESIYAEHINPGQVHYYKILGFSRVLIRRAQGAYYYDDQGARYLDLAGGAGCNAMGHNHPRLVRVRQRFESEQRHEIAQWFYSQYLAALSRNLATLAPGDLDGVFVYNTGSEAMEAALKASEKFHGPGRSRLIYAENSFHGRTRATLSISDAPALRSTFKLFSEHIKVPFGDASSLEHALEANRDVGAVVLEPVQGGAGVIFPPDGYLARVRQLCDARGVLLILDEIQCGLGRCGNLFAFEHDGVIPDMVAIAKPLSGVKTAISALLVRRPIFRKITAEPKEWHINVSSTFGGMGEACATAIEVLNTIVDEKLVERSRELGAYFLDKLRELQRKHPRLVKEVRGRGLMLGVELHDLRDAALGPFSAVLAGLDERLKGSLAGLLAAVLLARHKAIVGLTGTNPNVLRVYPPFVIEKPDIDGFVDGFDQTLEGGLVGIATAYVRSRF